MKSKDRRKLEKELLRLWSLIVRSKGFCEVCGANVKHSVLHAHHIYSVRHQGTKYNLDNGISLCPAHHLYFAHKDIMEFSDWVRDHRPRELLDRLKIWANTPSKLSQLDIELMLQDYKHKYEDLTIGTEQTKIRKED